MEKRSFDRSEISLAVASSFLKRYLKTVFHADLHPGKILIMEDEKVAFLDFGMTGNLAAETRDMFLDGATALVKGDISLFVALLKSFGKLGA
jgi:ubiquinone biosynthesis protein